MGVVVAKFGELLESLPLGGGEMLGDFDADANMEIAPATTGEGGNALSTEAENLVRSGARRNFQVQFAIEAGDADFRPQSELGEGDGHLAKKIILLTLEDRVRTDAEDHVEIAGGTTPGTGFPLASSGPTISSGTVVVVVDGTAVGAGSASARRVASTSAGPATPSIRSESGRIAQRRPATVASTRTTRPILPQRGPDRRRRRRRTTGGCWTLVTHRSYRSFRPAWRRVTGYCRGGGCGRGGPCPMRQGGSRRMWWRALPMAGRRGRTG